MTLSHGEVKQYVTWETIVGDNNMTTHRKKDNTVNSYNGFAYKELFGSKELIFIPRSLPFFIICKKYGYSGSGFKELSLRTNLFSSPNAYKSMQIRLLSGNPLLVKFAPRRLITR